MLIYLKTGKVVKNRGIYLAIFLCKFDNLTSVKVVANYLKKKKFAGVVTLGNTLGP